MPVTAIVPVPTMLPAEVSVTDTMALPVLAPSVVVFSPTSSEVSSACCGASPAMLPLATIPPPPAMVASSVLAAPMVA